MTPSIKFVIYTRLTTGDEFVAFHWCRSAAAGVARARREATEFGYHNVADVWAEPLNNTAH